MINERILMAMEQQQEQLIKINERLRKMLEKRGGKQRISQ